MKDIKGKIAAILGNKAIVINKGKVDGVLVGMIFGVKLNIPDIVDPDDETNVLSNLYYTKGKVKIESVSDRMAFGAIQPKRFVSSISGIVVPTWGEKAEYPEISGTALINDEDWKIKIGDDVFLLPAEKEEKKQ